MSNSEGDTLPRHMVVFLSVKVVLTMGRGPATTSSLHHAHARIEQADAQHRDGPRGRVTCRHPCAKSNDGRPREASLNQKEGDWDR